MWFFNSPKYYPVEILSIIIVSNDVRLIEAAYKNDLSLVKSLLEEGIDPNAQDKRGHTALQNAVDNGNIEITQLLLAHGADPNIGNIYNNHPLDQTILRTGAIALHDGATSCVSDYYENKEAKKLFNDISLNNRIKLIKTLLASAPSLNLINKYGYTAKYLSISNRYHAELEDLAREKKEKYTQVSRNNYKFSSAFDQVFKAMRDPYKIDPIKVKTENGIIEFDVTSQCKFLNQLEQASKLDEHKITIKSEIEAHDIIINELKAYEAYQLKYILQNNDNINTTLFAINRYKNSDEKKFLSENFIVKIVDILNYWGFYTETYDEKINKIENCLRTHINEVNLDLLQLCGNAADNISELLI